MTQPPTNPKPASADTPDRFDPHTGQAIADMINAFLKWPLPKTVHCDPCCSDPGFKGRTGTNLLTIGEAMQMMQEVVCPIIAKHIRDTPTRPAAGSGLGATPLPWHYTFEPNAKRGRGKFLTVFPVGDDCPVCDVNRHRGPNAEANAALIVESVNAHADLKAQLQGAADREKQLAYFVKQLLRTQESCEKCGNVYFNEAEAIREQAAALLTATPPAATPTDGARQGGAR